MADSGDVRPPARALPQVPGSNTIVVIVDRPITCNDLADLSETLREALEGSGADVVMCDVGALVDVDVDTIDALARLSLVIQRLGRKVGLRHVGSELRGLLRLMGLCDVGPLAAGLLLEPQRQPEQGEDAGGVQERVQRDDPAV